MLQKTARVAIRAPRRILAIGVLIFIAAAVFGVPVAKSLSPGGFQDPNSESGRAISVLSDKFGQSGQQVLILVTAPGGTNSEPARKVGADLVDRLQKSPLVYNVSSPWTAPPQASADLVSRDGKSGLIVVNLKGGEDYAQSNAQTLADQFIHDRDGVTVRAGGAAMQYAQINTQNQADLLVMELIALPLSFLVLIWVFGGLLAAALPMALVVSVGATCSGFLAARFGPRRPMLAGFGCAAAGAVVVAAGSWHGSATMIIIGLTVIGLCSLRQNGDRLSSRVWPGTPGR